MQHSEGLGTPDPELVRRRAMEIARINGHEAYTEADWQEAKRELHGGHEMNDTNGNAEIAALISEHDMIAGSVGRHIERVMPEDNDNVLEELVAEGMDEAVHEQMLASRALDVDENRDDPDSVPD